MDNAMIETIIERKELERALELGRRMEKECIDPFTRARLAKLIGDLEEQLRSAPINSSPSSQDAAAVPHAPAPCRDRGIRSTRRIARNDNRRSPASR
jgi:hypothetical protein